MKCFRRWVLDGAALLLIARAFIGLNSTDEIVLRWIGVPHSNEGVAWYFFFAFYGFQAGLLFIGVISVVMTLIERWHQIKLSNDIAENVLGWLWSSLGISMINGIFYVAGGVLLFWLTVFVHVVFLELPFIGVLDFIMVRFGGTVGYGFVAMLMFDIAHEGHLSRGWRNVLQTKPITAI